MDTNTYRQELTRWLALLRGRVLEDFVQDLIPALKQNGYEFEDLLNAMANHIAARPDWQQASSYMQQAQEEIKKVKAAVNKDDG